MPRTRPCGLEASLYEAETSRIDNLGTADEVTTMRKAFGAAVLAVLWLAAAPGRADVASDWQAFLGGDYDQAIADYTAVIRLDPDNAKAGNPSDLGRVFSCGLE